jgi:excinuclease ABC subunit C
MEKQVSIQVADTDREQVRRKLNSLPAGPGVYQFRDRGGALLYIGKAQSIRNRVRQYFQNRPTGSPRIDLMISKIHDCEVILTDSDVEALILEANLVKQHNPRYNVLLKDDKSFPYIVITNEPYPRVFVTRKVARDGARYFGPYTDVKTMRYALKTIRDIFRIRSCNYFIDDEFIRRKKARVCLDYHIKKCDGPCEGLIGESTYNAMINRVAELLQGRTEAMIDEFRRHMERASDERRFEDAAEYRDKMRALEVYSEHQKVEGAEQTERDAFVVSIDGDDACGVVFKIREGKLVGRQHYYFDNAAGGTEPELLGKLIESFYLGDTYIPSEIMVPGEVENEPVIGKWLSGRATGSVRVVRPADAKEEKLVRMFALNAKYLLDEMKLQRKKRGEFIPKSLQALQKDLRLQYPPLRIECFDVSNIQGSDIVASMVCFDNGKPKKSEYRKFRITGLDQADDYASMKQAVYRRYERLLKEQETLPDLIVIDGGRGQLSSARASLRELGIEHVAVVGLAKRLEEIFVPGASDPQTLPKASPALRLLQRIRDEAHRFAVTYHRQVRGRRLMQSELDLIAGIGAKRSKVLLEVFGSVQGVKHASGEQLAEVVGEKLAERIRLHFHDRVVGNSDESEHRGEPPAGADHRRGSTHIFTSNQGEK